MKIWLFVFFVLLLGLSCSPSDGGDDDDSGTSADDDATDDDASDDDNATDDDDDDDDDTTLPEATVTVDAPPVENPLARRVVVETDRPCSLSGYITTAGESGHGPSVPASSPVGTTHVFWFVGLLENSSFDYTFCLAGKAGAIVTEGTFDTDPLPAGETPSVASLVTKDDPSFSDWYLIYHFDDQTLLNLRLIYDRKGRIRFYHPSDAGDFVQVLDNGDFVSTTHSSLVATRLDGTEYELFPVLLDAPVMRDTHHKFHVESFDSDWAMVMFARYGPGVECDLVTYTESAVGDGIAQINKAGQEVWRFDHFDHQDQLPPEAMDPDFCQLAFWGPDTFDLTHGNAVSPYPGQNAYLVSYLAMDRIIKVSRDTGEILWQLGHDLDFTWIGTQPEDEKWFLLQHEPVWLEGDHLLLFDNNKGHTWSRALELAVNLVDMTVQQVWEYRVPYHFGGGNAQRNENGNTLISSGASHLTVEVPPGGGAGDELFLMEYTYAFTRAQYYPALWVNEPW